ncbi:MULTISPECIES: GGDEF domain-containing protein [Colwellia]|uniref:diguanylate cyclase n=1 Tax=Colwellia marinimaniae TaxID=1513592 RepID=A0ABQ0N199_9GAMM|nr:MULTISPECIES: GGDEF domain-containing protein [Colwellia]GAW97811.1 GGDEF domain-containing protein [Colwellia marinimaniae]
MNSNSIESNKYKRLHIKGVLLLWLVTCCNLASGQQENLPNPVLSEQLILTHQDDISATLKLADEIRRFQPLKFQQLMQNLSIKDDFTIEQQHLFNFLKGYGYTFRGELDKAEKQFKSILASDASQLTKFRASYTLVHVYAVKKMWYEGLELVATNIKTSTSIENSDYYQAYLITTIIFYKNMKQYDLSLHYIKELSAQILSPKLDCISKQLALEVKFYLNELKSSDPDTAIAINSCKKTNDIMVTSIIRVYQAKAYLAEQDVNGALDSLLPYMQELDSSYYPELITGVNNTLAQAYWQANDIASSKHYAEKALLSNKNNNNVNQATRTYQLLYQIAKTENNPSSALNFHEKYAELERLYSDDIKTKNLAFQLAKNKNLVQQNKIDLLNEKNNVLAAEQALAETKIANRHLVLVLLTFIIVALVLFALRFWRTHKRVKELAEWDSLTGIFNRGHYTQVTNSALKYCKNAQQDLSLIMFDLDYFKKVNDCFGHACGDWALKAVTKACKSIGRKNDIFARIGGEEFCIVLPSCNIDVAMLRAEACRAAIEDIITDASGCEFTITASFGVTDVKRSGFDLDKLLADADFAAYASKNSGRNRVTLFEVPANEAEEKLDSSWSYS